MSALRVYYRVDLLLESPLSIGAADSVFTDHDVVLDSRGLPIIPASSLAGVYRSFFDSGEADAFFGKRLFGDDGSISSSEVRVYDATWIGGNSHVSTRDNVSLEKRVAIPGLKFDRQIVERGSTFRAYIELLDADKCQPSEIEKMLAALDSGELLFGSKSTRGFGRMRVESCLRRSFDLRNPSDQDAWLDFEMFEQGNWDESQCEDITGQICDAHAGLNSLKLRVELDLDQRGAVSVREYSTEPDQPDFGQLYIRTGEGEGADLPVVPGTSWAGAFRDRYKQFSCAEQTDSLFGFVGKNAEAGSKTNTQKSRIVFSESVLHDGEWKEITRNSIDRFTGGTKDGALFTLRTYYGGRTNLEICIDEGFSDDDIKPLLMVLADLHKGFLSVGGLAAVGHGLFRISNARLSIGSKQYDGFFNELVQSDCGGFAQPNVDAMTSSVMHLLTSGTEGGSHE